MKMIIQMTGLFMLLSVLACNTTEPPGNETLTLKVVDVSCTEAWLQLTTNNIQLPTTINVLENNSIYRVFNLNTQDSLLYIDSLLPNQSYKFKIALNTTNNPQPTTNEVLAITMDTTSHNFTWQTFEFGIQTNVSRLFDVAIINENNIWAVGEIFMNDSLGSPDPMPYNAVHWNGLNWEIKKIAVMYNGNNTIAPLKGIRVLPSGEIIFSSGLPYLPQGNGWRLYHLWDIGVLDQNDGSVDKIWGTSINDLYFVGSKGTIVHYNGSIWTKLESGTNLFLADIAENSNNKMHICGLNMATVYGIIVKSDNGTNFSTLVESDNIPPSQLFKPKLYGTISSICFDQSNTLYAAGNLVYQYKFNRWDYLSSLPENYIGGNPGTFYRGYVYKIRATASNDIWIAGDRNTLKHFNGSTWQQVGMPYDPQIDLVWRGMETKDNITVVVGSHNSNAIIMMIKK